MNRRLCHGKRGLLFAFATPARVWWNVYPTYPDHRTPLLPRPNPESPIARSLIRSPGAAISPYSTHRSNHPQFDGERESKHPADFSKQPDDGGHDDDDDDDDAPRPSGSGAAASSRRPSGPSGGGMSGSAGGGGGMSGRGSGSMGLGGRPGGMSGIGSGSSRVGANMSIGHDVGCLCSIQTYH